MMNLTKDTKGIWAVVYKKANCETPFLHQIVMGKYGDALKIARELDAPAWVENGAATANAFLD